MNYEIELTTEICKNLHILHEVCKIKIIQVLNNIYSDFF